MVELVYGLCAVTSMVCTVLLARAYRRTRVRLLLWSAICFGCLVVNNLMLTVDLVLFPSTDLSLPRLIPAVLGVGVLIYGFVEEEP